MTTPEVPDFERVFTNTTEIPAIAATRYAETVFDRMGHIITSATYYCKLRVPHSPWVATIEAEVSRFHSDELGASLTEGPFKGDDAAIKAMEENGQLIRAMGLGLHIAGRPALSASAHEFTESDTVAVNSMLMLPGSPNHVVTTESFPRQIGIRPSDRLGPETNIWEVRTRDAPSVTTLTLNSLQAVLGAAFNDTPLPDNFLPSVSARLWAFNPQASQSLGTLTTEAERG